MNHPSDQTKSPIPVKDKKIINIRSFTYIELFSVLTLINPTISDIITPVKYNIILQVINISSFIYSIINTF